MKILIIGGGWVGCHLYKKLQNKYSVQLIEKNKELFSESSFYNQNRLHLGFHYPRNFNTRNLCKTTFDKFISDYGNFVEDVPKNIYCVPRFESNIDFSTYVDIFRDFEFEKVSVDELTNIEGCINVNEKFINNIELKKFFNSTIEFNNKEITQFEIKKLSSDFDLIINCTNNQLKNDKRKLFYELTISLVYEKIKDVSFDAITLIDGLFYSIFPYGNNFFTLTDVKLTPLKKFSTHKKLKNFQESLDKKFFESYQKKFDQRVKKFFPKFDEYFKYKSYFTSVKCKNYDNSDSRYPIVHQYKNIITCSTGKIQGIYIIEDYILKQIEYYESTNR